MKWLTSFGLVMIVFIVITSCDPIEEEDVCPIVSELVNRTTPWWPLSVRTPIIGVNHTRERLDYSDTVVTVLQELGARVVVLDNTSEIDKLTGYWGLHLESSHFSKFSKTQQINSIIGLRDLFGDKDGLTRIQRHARYEIGPDFTFTARSFILPEDYFEFKAATFKTPNEVYVRKSLNTHSGSGVQLMHAQDIVVVDDDDDDSFVVQKYVDDPLLVSHYKFDVRWWCVITNVHPLRAYVLPDGYAKIASSLPYDPRDISSKCNHVTNNAVQKQCRSGRPHRMIDASVRSQDFERRIAPVTGEDLFQGALLVLKKLIFASHWRMQVLPGVQQRKKEVAAPKMFQMLAIDVIYEREGNRAVLLEVNTNGYLRSGMMSIPNGRDKLKQLFMLVGMVGYPQDQVLAATEKHHGEIQKIEEELEENNRGDWVPLFQRNEFETFVPLQRERN